MTIRDILDTSISEMWSVVSPFVIGYLIFYTVFFLVALSFIVFTFIKVMKDHKEFKKRFRSRW